MSGSDSDTICAISTPIGTGAIGIVRLSGSEAVRIAGQVFRAADGTAVDAIRSHSLKYGHVLDGERTVDEVLLAVMRAPATYTREDVVEVHCHGGSAALRAVLDLLLARGARLAGPGEFTRRAFVNGRIDLTQAGAVLEVIQSRTRAGLRAAAGRLQGKLGERVGAIREDLVQAGALLEASIDFPDDELPDLVPDLAARLDVARERIDNLLAGSESGMLYRHGVTVALAGKPNVGKSSLFNRLVREARAIVTEVPGTTRDVIEETINIEGVPVRLLDSAGLHAASDKPARIGVEYARRAIEQADLVLLVLDASQPLDEEDRQAVREVSQPGNPWICVLNKSDLSEGIDRARVEKLAGGQLVSTSATTGRGIADLERAVADSVFSDRLVPPEDALVASAREAECLKRARTAIDAFTAALQRGIDLEVAAIDLRDAMNALGEVTGEITTEDLLDRIFGQFCIGK